MVIRRRALENSQPLFFPQNALLCRICLTSLIRRPKTGSLNVPCSSILSSLFSSSFLKKSVLSRPRKTWYVFFRQSLPVIFLHMITVMKSILIEENEIKTSEFAKPLASASRDMHFHFHFHSFFFFFALVRIR